MDEGQQQQGQSQQGRLDPDAIDPSGELRDQLDQAAGLESELDAVNTKIVQKVREALGMSAAQRSADKPEQSAPPARQQPGQAAALPPPHQPRAHRR